MFKVVICVNKFISIVQFCGVFFYVQCYDEIGKVWVWDDVEFGFGFVWLKVENDWDYFVVFKVYKIELGVGEWKGLLFCLQVICVVLLEWVEKVGNLYDFDNLYNCQFFDQVKVWVESWGGKGLVIVICFDFDEKGGVVVDVLVFFV